jgi:hypothetical protein
MSARKILRLENAGFCARGLLLHLSVGDSIGSAHRTSSNIADYCTWPAPLAIARFIFSRSPATTFVLADTLVEFMRSKNPVASCNLRRLASLASLSSSHR